MRMTRREATLAGIGVAVYGAWTPGRAALATDPVKPPPLDPEMVQSVVGASHRDFDRVVKLVTEQPSLVRAAWDWGGGDFETALGAAAHTGRVSIAEFLLSKGAPMDLFAAAMLGKLDVVKGVLETMPEQLHTAGPHGIPLIAHTRFEQSSAVKAYLETLGASM